MDKTTTDATEKAARPQQTAQPIAAVMPAEGFVAIDQMFSHRPRGNQRGRTGFTPFGRTAFYAFIKDGVIPAPKRLGTKTPSRVARANWAGRSPPSYSVNPRRRGQHRSRVAVLPRFGRAASQLQPCTRTSSRRAPRACRSTACACYRPATACASVGMRWPELWWCQHSHQAASCKACN